MLKNVYEDSILQKTPRSIESRVSVKEVKIIRFMLISHNCHSASVVDITSGKLLAIHHHQTMTQHNVKVNPLLDITNQFTSYL
ncbi:hypothetical protein EWB00_002707 [Schistosoma japonicum]|uniref:Uncharacterized protein n=1 Tax=Schistosoma japonicum TaxID=6182 RepID=A0A4Z2DB15_SCHJA|nr:hypothetical protein EWB00_002707 [Schistosoma japonicum]